MKIEIITGADNNPVAEFFSASNTPETDAAVLASEGQWSFVLKETCQRLERERDEARKEAEYWKDTLKLLGETPEKVFESWRIRHTNVFKYIRLMVSWREKYNISKKEHDNTKKEAEYYRERYNQLKDELKS